MRYGMNTMQEYHNHYLLMNVLLLTNFFENFRRSVMERHKLDCLHFITLPVLAWAMALKHTDAKLDLITDPDIYLTIEGGMPRSDTLLQTVQTWRVRPHAAQSLHHLSGRKQSLCHCTEPATAGRRLPHSDGTGNARL